MPVTIQELDARLKTAFAFPATYHWPVAAIEALEDALEALRAKDAEIGTLQRRNEALRGAAVSLDDQLAALRAANDQPRRAQTAGYPSITEEA